MQLIPSILLAFLLIGCCSPKNWVYKEVISDFPQFDSKQLTHLCEDTFSGFEVQFLKGEFGTLGFLNIYIGQVPSDTVVLQIGEVFHCYQGVLMEGNQRMQLPDEATTTLIQALLEGETVQISMDNFSSLLSPENFTKKYKKFSSRA